MVDDVKQLHKPVVLIVEDDPPVREMLRDVLNEIDYHVVAVADGDAALRVMRTTRVDLVTLDLDIPGLTGSEVLHVIHKRNGYTPHVVIVTSTAPVSRELQAQAEAVFSKPFDIDALIENVHTILGTHHPIDSTQVSQPVVE